MAADSDASSGRPGAAPPLPAPTGVPLAEPSWQARYQQLQQVNVVLARAVAQEPVQFRQLAQLALQLASRPGNHRVDAAQAAAFCVRMLS